MAKRSKVTKTVNGKVTFLDKKTPKEKILIKIYNLDGMYKEILVKNFKYVKIDGYLGLFGNSLTEWTDNKLKEQAKEIFKDFPKLPKCTEHPQGDGAVCGWCHNNRRKEIKFILKLKKKYSS